ncbi:MAG: alanine racemase [Patescibacteria group bacterium]
MLKSLFQKWRHWRFPYIPLVEITINMSRLLGNLQTFQKIDPRVAIAPVLKSNAYGHGLALVAKILDTQNLPFLIVDSYYEAVILRNEKIRTPILIIGYTLIENILKNKLKNVAFTIVSIEQLEEISKNLKTPTDFHLKIDTNMHRHGIPPEQCQKAMSLIRANGSLHLSGICSHLADSDSTTKEFTENQIKIWNSLTEDWKKEFPNIKYFHLSNTAGFSYSKNIHANMARLGIGLYGIDPSADQRFSDLQPVLEMKTLISGAKDLKRGEKVGYGATFEATKNMRIATIPAGYYEGIDRQLSNCGFVKIENTFCPIVGRVSMNIATIDVTNVPHATINTSVTVISKIPSDKNSIQNNAKLVEKIPYDLMVHIPQTLRRRVV